MVRLIRVGLSKCCEMNIRNQVEAVRQLGLIAGAKAWSTTIVLGCVLSAVLLSGCSRKSYRLWADRDAYSLLESRQDDPSWDIPERTVEPDPISRLADVQDPDCGALPPDDPSANQWMRHPYCFDNTKYWDKIGHGPEIDSGHWEAFLPTGEDGKINLTQQNSLELALLHSRNYQGQVESVYSTALQLAANRFEFDTNWSGGGSTNYSAFGNLPAGSRSLSQSTNLGFRRILATGGQFAANIANSFAWQLDGSGISSAGGNIVLELTQPLLRGAYKHVRLEGLTQSERQLLYRVRDFARFRRSFYLNISRSYLNLLTQLQALENQRVNLTSLELSLSEHQELYNRQMVSLFQVDQVYQDYQSGRINLLGAEQRLQNSLDQFKFLIGLPPKVGIKVDKGFLNPFQLNNPLLEELQAQTDEAHRKMIQFLPPEIAPREVLVEAAESNKEILAQLGDALPELDEEMGRWEQILEAGIPATASKEEVIDFDQQEKFAERLRKQLDELVADTQAAQDGADMVIADARNNEAIEAWRSLSRTIGRDLRELVSSSFTIQNQVRLFLIEITPFHLEEEEAVQMALSNRLDLMNQRATVTDAFRRVEVAADRLESNLDVSARANIGTDSSKSNAFGFDSAANSYQLGVSFDGPLNRFGERNSYRNAQIQFQQARREFMSTEDSIANEVRADLRDIELSALNFQISRQQLIRAARQVEQSQLNVRLGEDRGSSPTRDLLQALQGLLNAKNRLISSWIAYETARIAIFVDLELLYLDSEGNWINQDSNPGEEMNGELNATAIRDLPSLELQTGDLVEPLGVSERNENVGSNEGS